MVSPSASSGSDGNDLFSTAMPVAIAATEPQ
jgi:hypothetical protein